MCRAYRRACWQEPAHAHPGRRRSVSRESYQRERRARGTDTPDERSLYGGSEQDCDPRRADDARGSTLRRPLLVELAEQREAMQRPEAAHATERETMIFRLDRLLRAPEPAPEPPRSFLHQVLGGQAPVVRPERLPIHEWRQQSRFFGPTDLAAGGPDRGPPAPNDRRVRGVYPNLKGFGPSCRRLSHSANRWRTAERDGPGLSRSTFEGPMLRRAILDELRVP